MNIHLAALLFCPVSGGTDQVDVDKFHGLSEDLLNTVCFDGCLNQVSGIVFDDGIHFPGHDGRDIAVHQHEDLYFVRLPGSNTDL